MRARFPFRRAAAAAAFVIWPAIGHAENWRFCVSASFSERRAYISDIFDNGSSREILEKWFDQTLTKSGKAHEFVQCPLGSGKAVAQYARNYAEQFNEELGFKIIPVR